MGSKWKTKANVMSWKSVFHYENIKKHLIGQYPDKWKGYLSLSNDAKDIFFKGAVSFYNNLQSHFFGISQGKHAIIFDLK